MARREELGGSFSFACLMLAVYMFPLAELLIHAERELKLMLDHAGTISNERSTFSHSLSQVASLGSVWGCRRLFRKDGGEQKPAFMIH